VGWGFIPRKQQELFMKKKWPFSYKHLLWGDGFSVIAAIFLVLGITLVSGMGQMYMVKAGICPPARVLHFAGH
jgi:hypothetical protein